MSWVWKTFNRRLSSKLEDYKGGEKSMTFEELQYIDEAIASLKKINLSDRIKYDKVRLQVEEAIEACRRARSKLQAELALQGVEVVP
jgi:hypothetical protein